MGVSRLNLASGTLIVCAMSLILSGCGKMWMSSGSRETCACPSASVNAVKESSLPDVQQTNRARLQTTNTIVGRKVTGASSISASGAAAVVPTQKIARVQEALNAHGYVVRVDGVNGGKTSMALKDFQKKNGIAVTGSADKATLSRLGVQ